MHITNKNWVFSLKTIHYQASHCCHFRTSTLGRNGLGRVGCSILQVIIYQRKPTSTTWKGVGGVLTIKETDAKSWWHGAVWWAQSELFFRLLLKNTVCSPLQAAYAYFWRGLPKGRLHINASFKSYSVRFLL